MCSIGLDVNLNFFLQIFYKESVSLINVYLGAQVSYLNFFTVIVLKSNNPLQYSCRSSGSVKRQKPRW